jgi:hypothetical protein
MPSNRLTVRHLIAGGWATAFGPTAVNAVPDNAGVVQVPFLVDAENCIFSLDGGLDKPPGTTKLNSSALDSGAAIMGIVDFWVQGTAGTATQKRVIHVGTRIRKDDADGNFVSIKAGLVSGAVPNYATFDDLLIIASNANADVPLSYDGTTLQNLAGSPPNFSFSVKHKNFHFAAGVDANPSTLYYCSQLDPEDWSGGTSGSIQIDPDDGDRITGLISHKNELWVFKGPNKGSIHRITGTNNTDWGRTTFVEGVGAVWQNSIFHFGDDIGFLWSDGSIRSLSATDAYGDFAAASLTTPIQPWITAHLNFNKLKEIWAVEDGPGEKVYFTVPIDGSATNNTILCLDFRFSPARWTHLPAYSGACIAKVLDPTSTGRPITMIGGYDGFVRKWNNPTKSIDGDTAIGYKVTFPHLDYGVPEKMKTLEAGGLGIEPKNDGNIIFNWTRDANTSQTITVGTGGSDVLAPANADQFTLGTSQLAGTRFANRWFETEEGGEFRSIQYQFTNSVNNEDVDIHNFTAILTLGGESTEND